MRVRRIGRHRPGSDLAPTRWERHVDPVIGSGATRSEWAHRPRWKVAINTVLRAVQRGPVKWLSVSCCEGAVCCRPRAIGYGITRIRCD